MQIVHIGSLIPRQLLKQLSGRGLEEQQAAGSYDVQSYPAIVGLCHALVLTSVILCGLQLSFSNRAILGDSQQWVCILPLLRLGEIDTESDNQAEQTCRYSLCRQMSAISCHSFVSMEIYMTFPILICYTGLTKMSSWTPSIFDGTFLL